MQFWEILQNTVGDLLQKLSILSFGKANATKGLLQIDKYSNKKIPTMGDFTKAFCVVCFVHVEIALALGELFCTQANNGLRHLAK